MVVPHAGTWIEISKVPFTDVSALVVPHAGTWIEILLSEYTYIHTQSFPTRERGLKSFMEL